MAASSYATLYGPGFFPAIMGHMVLFMLSCLIPSMSKGRQVTWWLSMAEGVVHSLGVTISPPLLEICYSVHSPCHY